jgi:hypothetical protein
MWAGVVTGKNLHVWNERKKHEKINDRNPSRAGYNRFGTRIQGTNWPAKTSARDGHSAAPFTTPRGRGSDSARI